MSLIRLDLSFDRRAIMVFAWASYRGPFNQRGTRWHKPFGYFLADAWKLARCARQRRADGALARETAEAAARVTALEAFRNSLSAEQRAASDAWLIASCSTDGRRVPDHRLGA